MEERWEHASLLASGPASPTRGGRAAAFAAAPSLLSSAGRSEELEPASPLNGWEESLERRAFRQLPGGGDAVRHSGWLLKAAGDGPQRQWRRRFVYLTADRLCYTPDPDAPGVRYLAVDRIPVRALPRGYGPKLGVALVDDHQIQRPPAAQPFSPKKAGCVFSVTCGAHTHFFAAPSPAEAKASGCLVGCGGEWGARQAPNHSNRQPTPTSSLALALSHPTLFCRPGWRPSPTRGCGAPSTPRAAPTCPRQRRRWR